MMQPHGCCHDDFAALFPASSDVLDRCSAAGSKWPNCLIGVAHLPYISWFEVANILHIWCEIANLPYISWFEVAKLH